MRYGHLGLTFGLLLAAATCGERAPRRAEEAAPEKRVEIVAPADGDTVVGPEVEVVLRAVGVRVAPALGERVEGEGHHHLFVDTEVTPPGDTIPKDVPGIVHLGTGAERFVVKDLAPGPHRIVAVFAWGDHVPIPDVAPDTVRIVVQAP
jgi:hypothetical protein